ncbi:MAG: DUF2066 domain-containing protein [Gammaproteobacteria bacterium]
MMKLSSHWWSIVLLMLCCIQVQAQAAAVTNLYQGEISVTSESATERQNAISEAFAQVLTKVSGNRQIVEVDSVKEKLTAADAYVQQYRYIHVPALAGKQEHILLQIKFDAQAVNSLIASAGQGVWNSERPLSLVWIAMATPEGREVVTNDSLSSIPQLIQEAAEQQGLPMVLPMLDLDDVQTVNFNDVWLPFTSVLEQHSKRYHKDAMVVVRMTQDDEGHWHTRWILQYKNQSAQWEIDNASLPVVIKQALGNINDYFMSHSEGVKPVDDPSKLLMDIHNVTTAAAYAKVMAYLQHLPGVNGVDVKSVAGDHLLVWLNVFDDKTTLEHVLTEGSILQPLPEKPIPQLVRQSLRGDSPSAPQLEYRLLS